MDQVCSQPSLVIPDTFYCHCEFTTDFVRIPVVEFFCLRILVGRDEPAGGFLAGCLFDRGEEVRTACVMTFSVNEFVGESYTFLVFEQCGVEQDHVEAITVQAVEQVW